MPDAAIVPVPIDQFWYAAISRRVSRRRFDGRRVDAATLERIERLCERMGVSQRGGRAVLVRHAPDAMFTGLVGAYGGVQGAPSAVAFVGATESRVDLGYLGEAVILEATAAGLDTCWVAGSFDPAATRQLLELSDAETVQAVTPLGYGVERKGVAERMLRGVVSAHKRLELDTIALWVEAWPDWARAAAEAVRLAPSGGNGQPWRLRMEGDDLVLARKAEKPYWTWEFDCGIAMLHAELGALQAGVRGAWERLEDPDVAVFRKTNDEA